MKLNYIKSGDYYIPNIKFDNENYKPLGKYGRMRKAWLMEYHKPLFNHLLLGEQLVPHLNEVDEQAWHLLDVLIPLYRELYDVNDELKMSNQFEWVGRMNNIVSQIEEIIYRNNIQK